jgi:hypothetical protein
VTTTQQYVFHIRGRNPLKDVAVSYFAEQAQSILGETPWFVKRVAKQESGTPDRSTTYYQFNELGTIGADWDANLRDEPNYGYPDGWGIYHPDPPSSGQVLWDWKVNVQEGMTRLKTKHDTPDGCSGGSCRGAHRFWEEQKNQFLLWRESHPTPTSTREIRYNDITFYYPERIGDKSFEEAIWLKMYNGAEPHHFISWDDTDVDNQDWSYNETNSAGRNYVSEVCSKTDN